MHDSDPAGDSERELFAQLEDLALAVLDEDIDRMLYVAREESEDRRIQQDVLEALEAYTLEDTPDEIIAALVLARLEPDADMNKLSFRLIELSALPSPIGEQADRIGLVTAYICEIANVLNSCAYKSQVQTKILADDTLSPEVKRRLLDTLGSLSDEEGIDLDDIDQVGAALAGHQQEMLEEQEQDRIRDDAKAALLEKEEVFLKTYNVHPQDPVWKKAQNAGVTYVTLCLAPKMSPISPAALGATEALSTLRIPYAEYMKLLERIIDQLATK